MTPALDELFSSLFFVWITIACVFGAFFLITIPEIRWHLEDLLDWFVVRFSPRVEAWGMRHRRFLNLIDRAVIGPITLIGFLLALVFHHWFAIAFFGVVLWNCWHRLSKERKSDRERRYLEKLEDELHR